MFKQGALELDRRLKRQRFKQMFLLAAFGRDEEISLSAVFCFVGVFLYGVGMGSGVWESRHAQGRLVYESIFSEEEGFWDTLEVTVPIFFYR